VRALLLLHLPLVDDAGRGVLTATLTSDPADGTIQRLIEATDETGE